MLSQQAAAAIDTSPTGGRSNGCGNSIAKNTMIFKVVSRTLGNHLQFQPRV